MVLAINYYVTNVHKLRGVTVLFIINVHTSNIWILIFFFFIKIKLENGMVPFD